MGGTVDPSSVKRRLTCILAADALGYSKQVGQDEEGTIRVLSAHRAVIDGIITFHQGRIVSTAGDSVLAEFSSAVEAVRCAVEIQEALKTRNDSLPEHRQMHFRVGVNLGDVVVKNDDLLGDGVNVAARLETLAEPGGICISSSVYDQITGKLDLGFQDIGEQTLRTSRGRSAYIACPGPRRPCGRCRPRRRCVRRRVRASGSVDDRRRRRGRDRRGGGVAERVVAIRCDGGRAHDISGSACRGAAARCHRGKECSPGRCRRRQSQPARRPSPKHSACAPRPRRSGEKPRPSWRAHAPTWRPAAWRGEGGRAGRSQRGPDSCRCRSSRARTKNEAEAAARGTEIQAAKAREAQWQADARARECHRQRAGEPRFG